MDVIFSLIALLMSIMAFSRISTLREKITELEAKIQQLILSGTVAPPERAGELLPGEEKGETHVASAVGAISSTEAAAAKPAPPAPSLPPRDAATQISTDADVIPGQEHRPVSSEEIAADTISPLDTISERLKTRATSWFNRDATPPPSPVTSEVRSTETPHDAQWPPVDDLQRLEAGKTRQHPNILATKWKEIEGIIIENWLGVVGAVVMVTGVAFLGIYTALKMNAFYRFLLISGFAVLLAAAFLALRKVAKWERFAYWLGSSSAAIFLFGCFGSGYVPGLQWLSSPTHALGLILAGIAVNLYFAYFTASQNFTSIHTILSLIALAIAPPSQVTLSLAALVSLFSIAFSYRHRWDVHLLVVIGTFFCFNVYWSLGIHALANLEQGRMLGRVCTIVVAVTAGLIHYRKDYASPSIENLPLAAHLLNWFFLGVGLLMYAMSPLWSTMGLFAGAAVAFLTARRGRAVGVRWVYVTDTLVSLFLAYLAVISLNRLHVDTALIFFFAFATSMLFLAVMILEGEEKLRQIGIYLVHASGAALLAFSFYDRITPEVRPVMNTLCSLGGAALAALAFYAFLHRRLGEDFDCIGLYSGHRSDLPICSILGIMTCAFIALLAFHLYDRPDWVHYWEWLLLALLSGAILVRNRLGGSTSLGIGIVAALFAGQFLSYLNLSQLTQTQTLTAAVKMLKAVPLFVIPALLYQFSGNVKLDREIRNRCIYLAGIHALATSFFLLHPVSAYVPPLLWLVAAIAAFEAGKKLLSADNPDRATVGTILIQLALIFTLAIAFREAVFNLRIEPSAGGKVLTASMGAFFLILLPIAVCAAPRPAWSRALGMTVLAFLFGSMLITYANIMLIHPMTMSHKGLLLLPYFIMPALLIRYSGVFDLEFTIQRCSLYLFGMHTLAVPYLLLNNISPLIPGIVWLCLSAVYLEATRLTAARPPLDRGDASRVLLVIAFLAVAAFLGRHILVHLQFEDYLGPVRLRLLIEIFAMAVFAYWLAQKPLAKTYRIWASLQPLFMELILVFLTLSIAMEVAQVYYPLFWIGMAIVLLAVGMKAKPGYSRLKFYSLVYGWVAAIQVAVSTSTFVVPSPEWYKQPLLIGSLVVLVQFVFLLDMSRKPYLDGIEFPDSIRGMSQWVNRIGLRKNLWIFYPFFASVALFLFWCFDHSLLTLLWVLEAFGIFIMSLILIENHFRILALAALASCVTRLVFYDMAQSGTLARGLVFLGVGVIMLAMNAIYNKYKERMTRDGA